LLNAGFQVPNGFHVTTEAYRGFVAEHSLQAEILAFARPVVEGGAISFEQATRRISELFASRNLPQTLLAEIQAAYGALGGVPVAVRSSANAEDLPNHSFAGLQETYLNVRGPKAVVAAVKECWCSLWTERAMNYRHDMGIDNDVVAMAVVVQVMVPSTVSGILFTANPTNGDRSKMIVNCSYGLGEAVVSGQVTPDTHILDRESLNVEQSVIGAKEQMIVADGEQGTRVQNVSDRQRNKRSLSDDALRQLASLAIDVESELDGLPQDIEWAISGDSADLEFWLLQSRPITNLPPPPLKEVTWPEIPGAQLLKRQVAENMPDPLSPLFEELYLRAVFDAQQWPEGWEWQGRFTRNWAKNFVITTVNGYAYQPIYHSSNDDWKSLVKKQKKEQVELPWYTSLRRAFSMKHFMIQDLKGGRRRLVYLLAQMFRTFKKYPAIVTWEKRHLPDYLAVVERWRKLDPKLATGEELLLGMKSLTNAEAGYWQALRGVIGTAKMTDGELQKFLQENAPNEGFISGAFLSGFPSRTLDAEVAMRTIADRVRDDPAIYELTIVTPAPRLLDELGGHPDGKLIHDAIEKYLEEYGRQVFNLDFVEPTLVEQPLPFLMSFKALVRQEGYDLSARQKQVAKARRSKFLQALKYFKGMQRLEFLRLYWTARINYPAREEALFYMGLAWSVFRPLALEIGERLVATGTLSQPDDVFYLTSDDLRKAIEAQADDRAMPDLRDKAAEQRALRALRFRMDQPQAIPPLKSDKGPYSTIRANEGDEHVLRGFAVSPGTVTGIASVIMTPNDFDRMKPDSILVCPITTPAWTQLFPLAKGLVTDVGSILAHGSIVAREYGIPAVLGIGDVTQRVRSGQRITVDGDRGVVTILED
jgi:pyruvate,water dikinase